ncbi:hypothetical protein PQX77_002153, partial [Marasmius sp. AFHP31]
PLRRVKIKEGSNLDKFRKRKAGVAAKELTDAKAAVAAKAAAEPEQVEDEQGGN